MGDRSDSKPKADARKAKRAAPRSAWKKGQSGNPGGRKRTDRTLIERCRAMTPAVLDRLQAIATGKVDGKADGAPIAEDRDAIAAAKLILAYGHGQPTQPVDLDPKAKPGAPETPMGRVLRLITTPPKRDGAT